MSKKDSALLLYYDEYHTPVQKVIAHLGAGARLSILEIEIDFSSGIHENGVDRSMDLDYSKVDGRSSFADDFLSHAIKANAAYQRGYNLSAAISRPFLATKVAEHLKAKHITNLIHGFAGNDQVRFEMAIMVLAPEVKIQSIASLLGSQNVVNMNRYTISSNIWGRSVEGFTLEDPWNAPAEDVFERVTVVEKCTADPVDIQLEFEKGIPVAIDHRKMPLAALLENLDRIAKPYYIGVSDMLEDGFVGLKTRAIYEYPAAYIIRCAHQDLESLVFTRRQQEFKTIVDNKWSDLIYDGLWFDPQRESLEAYIDHVNAYVTGEVKLMLSCGGAHVIARRSPFALYDKSLAIYRAGQDFGIGCSQYLAQTMSTPMQASANRNRNNQLKKEI
jgi:argininosuccinate synthase